MRKTIRSWGTALWLCTASFTFSQQDTPNIIYFLADDLGYGEVGAYGQEKIKTPNIDALVASGMKFTQHYSGAPVCAPARYILLTGKHAGHAYIRGNDEWAERGEVWDYEKMFVNPGLEGQRPIPDSTVTLAELLKTKGYATGIFGKWGLGAPNTEGVPNQQGFDEFYGYNCQRQAHNLYPGHLWHHDKKVLLHNELIAPHQPLDNLADPFDEKSYARFAQKEYAPTLIHEKALVFIEKNQDQPFFLYYASPLPHLPLQAPTELVETYREQFGEEKPHVGDKGYFPNRYPRATYAAMISYLDQQLGELVVKLKALGLYGNTLIIFSSDNGATYTGGYAYNNLMYAVAGEVIQAVSGQHWTDFVGEHLFKPIGMVDAVAKVSEVFGQGNYVTPYLDHIEDGMVQVDYNRSDQIGAAGMIWASASDVANYLKFLDNDGIVGQDTLLKKETFDYLFKPHAFVTDTGFYPTQQLTNPNWKTYGLGWFQHDYRGQKLDFHTGSITGLVAMAGLMRDKDVAVYVFANLDHAELRHAILYKAIDLFAFDDISRGWHKEISQLYGDFKSQNKMRLAKMKEERAKDTNTTLPLTAYEGSYHHTMLGEVSVKIDGDGLLLVFNDFLKLEGKHWHYDTFVSTKNNPYYLETLFQFHLNPQGEVAVLEAFGEHFLKRQ
ncbi:sulfatase-like hydrolase/transferase [Flagellimonas lutaonensis]|uniref:Arylsulfatase n=1 Tax=Flagellimonas lutaonensis TaxID=516051 RepID=A0A0D5YT75_9FLAO|nr:sulfatase-like hydrolase/transferase [Allomuricauda lutaonensis]AKA35517.1 Arylsulfatase [Allomuricauda lutaonensis]